MHLFQFSQPIDIVLVKFFVFLNVWAFKALEVNFDKADRSRLLWDEAVQRVCRYDEIVEKLSPFLKSCGYKNKDLIFLPISGLLGVNIKDRVDAKRCPWYKVGRDLAPFGDTSLPCEGLAGPAGTPPKFMGCTDHGCGLRVIRMWSLHPIPLPPEPFLPRSFNILCFSPVEVR